ncbi:MAG: ferrochelatase [Anaerolineae bacterium]|nr:ferrochelatase [Anaerolineae bacterium]
MPAHPIGVLIAQLGTPDAPTPQALHPYLKQFLSDRRVIDYSPFIWQPILRGIILNTRPRRSARLYQRIWMEEGSPLLVYSQQQAEGLQARLGDDYRVIVGMRYGNPSIASAIAQFEAEGVDRILVVPMFPQFSCTTTASIYDAAYQAAAGRRCPLFHERKRFVPTLRFLEPYFDHPGYITAMRDHITALLKARPEAPDQFIITFHGIPKRYITTGDPYREHCERTAHLLAQAMGWRTEDWCIGFQSRFGPEPWLEPYTDDILKGLAAQGVKRPFVFSPGFVTDCLETLDELGNEGCHQFVEGGGSADQYFLAPSLNTFPGWLDTLADLIRGGALGWTASQPNYAPVVTAGL